MVSLLNAILIFIKRHLDSMENERIMDEVGNHQDLDSGNPFVR